MTTTNILSVFNNSWIAKSAKYINDPKKMLVLVERLMRYVSKKGLKEVKNDLLLLGSYIKDVACGNYKEYSTKNLMLAVGAIVYVVTPLDLIPDTIPVAGLADDVTVVCWAISQMEGELENYKAWRMQRC